MAGIIPRTFINGLLEKVDIVDVVNSRITLKKKGANYSACCPFHNEKTPSFTVSSRKQFFHCFGCGQSGDAIQFIMQFDRCSFVEAVEFIASSIGLDVTYEKNQGGKQSSEKTSIELSKFMEKITELYHKNLFASKTALEYLKKRGLNEAVIKRFKIGFSLDQWDQLKILHKQNPEIIKALIAAGMLIQKDTGRVYDRFRNRIMFPIFNRRGHVIGFGGRSLGNEMPKYLNSPETSLFQKGKELYGLFEAQDAVRQKDAILVVEGYMDVVALTQFGVNNVVASLGTAATTDHIKILSRYGKKIIFCFDGDNAGRIAAWRALENALPLTHQDSQIRFAFLPQGEDPDSFLRNQGYEKFTKQLDSALSLSEFLINNLIHEVNPNSIDGKTQLCQKAKPLLQKAHSDIFRQLIVERLAKIANIDSKTLNLSMGFSTLPKQPSFKPQKMTNESPSPLRTAITLILHHPELAQLVDNIDEFSDLNLPGMDLFLQLLNFAKQNPKTNSAMLLSAFSDHPQANALKKLLNRELFHVENGHIQEFKDILHDFEIQIQQTEIDKLFTKANTSGLTTEEKQKLQQLILDKHKTF